MKDRYQVIEEIAQRVLHLSTLKARHSDSLDFQEQAVWGIRQALEEAYEAGYKRGKA